MDDETELEILPNGEVKTKRGRIVPKRVILTHSDNIEEMERFVRRGYYNQFY